MRAWIKIGVIGSFAVAMLFEQVALAAAPPPGQGLEISPPVISLTADPGQTVTTQISVRNVTTGTLIATAEADDFGASSDETGSPKILTDETGASRYSLKYWIAPVSGVTLAPGELKTTQVVIHVPANGEPGGHYGVVRFTGLPPNLQGTGVALSASIGSLILMRVNGNVTDNLSVAQFSAGQQMTAEKWLTKGFFEAGPIDFLVRLQNTGSVHEQAKGSITVKSMFGGPPVVIAVNPNGGNVLPGSIRRFVQSWSEKKLFGHYTATLALTYAGSKPLSGVVSFWVIPWKLILLVLVGLIVVGYLLKIGLRRYNEHIIAQARRRR